MNLTITPLNTRPITQNKPLNFKAQKPEFIIPKGIFSVSKSKYIGKDSFLLDEVCVKESTKYLHLESPNDFYRELVQINGIKRLVDMLDEFSTLPKEKSPLGIEQLGINMHSDFFYTSSPFWSDSKYFSSTFWARPPFVDYKNQKLSPEMEKEMAKQTNAYIKKFVRFIQMMQEGNVLIRNNEIGSTANDSVMMFTLNKFFNPQADKIAVEKAAKKPHQFTLDALKNLYNNLTDADKTAMNWTTNFDKEFMQRLIILDKTQ